MLIVKKAIPNASIHAINRIQIVKGALYAKPCNHLLIKYQASGEAIKNEMTTSFKKSFDKRDIMPVVLAPRTFRIPISFVRCSTLKVVSPNNPRHEMKIAIKVKYLMIAASLSSAL